MGRLAAETVHILQGGVSVCGFDYGKPGPGGWPAGHTWVPCSAIGDATCRNCLSQVEDIAGSWNEWRRRSEQDAEVRTATFGYGSAPHALSTERQDELFQAYSALNDTMGRLGVEWSDMVTMERSRIVAMLRERIEHHTRTQRLVPSSDQDSYHYHYGAARELDALLKRIKGGVVG